MLMNKVSIVISTHNGEKYIKECVDSILLQTYQDFEIIIIDDCSSDSTVKVIQEMQLKDKRIHLHINKKQNHSNALNIGLFHAKGKYIARMDQDDLMTETRLMEQVSYMDSHPSIDVCCSWFSTIGDREDNVKIIDGDVAMPEYQLLVTNIFPNPTSMIRKSFIDTNSIKYNTKYQYAEDYAFWIECALAGAKFYIIPQYLLKYRIHKNQSSAEHTQEQYHETLKMRTYLINTLMKRHKSLSNVVNTIEELWNLSNKNLVSIETVFRVSCEIFVNSSLKI